MKVNKDEVIEDLNKIKDIVILANTAGGKELIDTLVVDIVADITKIVEGRELLTHNQYITIASDIKAKLDVVKVLKKAPANEKFLKGLLEELLDADTLTA